MLKKATRRLTSRRHQSGAAALAFVTLLVLASAGILLDRVTSRTQLASADNRQNSEALSQAKASLIAWAVSHPKEPGRLPWPDRNGDGNYDGSADCVTSGFANTHLLGRFPYAGDAAPCEVVAFGSFHEDGSGEPLWYAVSRNLLWNRGQGGGDPPINPNLLDGGASYPWLTVRDQNGNVISSEVAAVIIAPGAAIGNQDRSGSAPAVAQYLDSVTVGATPYDNSDADLDFIIYPDSRFTPQEADSFNDRLVYITIDELMRPVEKRVLGDAAVALQSYRTIHGRFPWMSPYRDPKASSAGDTLTGRVDAVNGGNRIIDNDANFPPDPVLEDHVIVNVTRRTIWEINDQHGPDDLHIKGSPDFQPGDAYNVRPAYNGIWGQREGHIPFIDASVSESHAVATGFTLTWSNGTASPPPSCSPLSFPGWLGLTALGCSQIQNSYQSGTFNQPQPFVPTPSAANGECIWTAIDDVDCFCHTASCEENFEVRSNAYTVEVVCIGACGGGTTILSRQVERELTYTFDYTGTGTMTTTNNVKTREVANTGPETIHMKDTITLLGIEYLLWEGDVTVPAGSYVMDEIFFDIEDGNEFPAYFFANLWHQYIYTKIAADHVAVNTDTGNPSSDNCVAGTDCVELEISGSTVRDDIQAVLVSAGGELGGQDRATKGEQSDYFEDENENDDNDKAERAVLATDFNDQVRIIWPSP